MNRYTIFKPKRKTDGKAQDITITRKLKGNDYSFLRVSRLEILVFDREKKELTLYNSFSGNKVPLSDKPNENKLPLRPEPRLSLSITPKEWASVEDKFEAQNLALLRFFWDTPSDILTDHPELVEMGYREHEEKYGTN